MSLGPALALCLALATLGLAACGSGAGASSSSMSTAQPSPLAKTTTPVHPGSSPAKPRSHADAPPQDNAVSAEVEAERRRAGRAAAFVKPHADNSIPTFGAEAAGSDRARAETSLRAYLSARVKGEWAAACRGLAASLRQQVEGLASASKKKGCPAAYAALAGSSPPQARANPLRGPLIALRRKARSGFALFYGLHSQKYVMPIANERGHWKVTQLAPVAYPLGSETPTPP